MLDEKDYQDLIIPSHMVEMKLHQTLRTKCNFKPQFAHHTSKITLMEVDFFNSEEWIYINNLLIIIYVNNQWRRSVNIKCYRNINWKPVTDRHQLGVGNILPHVVDIHANMMAVKFDRVISILYNEITLGLNSYNEFKTIIINILSCSNELNFSEKSNLLLQDKKRKFSSNDDSSVNSKKKHKKSSKKIKIINKN